MEIWKTKSNNIHDAHKQFKGLKVRLTRGQLTQRGNKVFVGTQGLHAALVLVVPDP